MDEKALELLRVFDLDGVADYKAANLPYGKQRKLEIARALATNPAAAARRACRGHEPERDRGS